MDPEITGAIDRDKYDRTVTDPSGTWSRCTQLPFNWEVGQIIPIVQLRNGILWVRGRKSIFSTGLECHSLIEKSLVPILGSPTNTGLETCILLVS